MKAEQIAKDMKRWMACALEIEPNHDAGRMSAVYEGIAANCARRFGALGEKEPSE